LYRWPFDGPAVTLIHSKTRTIRGIAHQRQRPGNPCLLRPTCGLSNPLCRDLPLWAAHCAPCPASPPPKSPWPHRAKLADGNEPVADAELYQHATLVDGLHGNGNRNVVKQELAKTGPEGRGLQRHRAHPGSHLIRRRPASCHLQTQALDYLNAEAIGTRGDRDQGRQGPGATGTRGDRDQGSRARRIDIILIPVYLWHKRLWRGPTARLHDALFWRCCRTGCRTDCRTALRP
jgi:hypothetical protein